MSDAPTRLREALANRYTIERELGRGGMATVYLAHDVKHDRDVALKVLRPELAEVLGRERFLAEIQTTAKLSHPHILPLHDSGDAGGQLFYVMPLIEGESLRQRMDREQTLPLEEALQLAGEIADALSYAHAHSVIHRDIKPENILLQSGHAIVADFGIARAVRAAGDERITQDGTALGTPLYMSPEQSAGEREVDGRSDLYALACVLYEMLAGEAPFRGATYDAILVQRFTRPPPRVSVKRPAIPRAVDSAIFTAMARSPDERFTTLEQFAAALETRSAAAESAERSIAVLPFANMSGDPENEYFSDGITEEIINALTQLPHVRVAARTSSFSFKGKNPDLHAIGDQLNVTTVLEGSVRRSGNRIRITAQLINVADGYHLWSERYDRELTDVFAIQDEIATAIAGKLRLTLGGNEGQLVRPPTTNVDAYDAFLRGHALIKQRGPALPLAVRAFEEAIALDSELALAHAELAEALLLMGLYGMVPPHEIRDRARDASARALALEPDLVLGHVVLGLYSLLVEFDRERSTQAFTRAVQLRPQDLEARTLQAVFDFGYTQGSFARAESQLREVLQEDPRSASAWAGLGIVLAWGRNTLQAAVEARRGIELDPHAFYPQWSLLHALAVGPDHEQAIAVGGPMLARFGRHPWLMMGMALAAGAAGRHTQAEALYAELAARARSEYVQPASLMAAAIGTGNLPLAIGHLRKAAEIHDPVLALMLSHWPPLDPLRPLAEFAAVLRQLGWDR